MFCSTCGSQVADGTTVCPVCGAAIDEQQASPAFASAPVGAAAPVAPASPAPTVGATAAAAVDSIKSKINGNAQIKKLIPIIGCAVAAVLVIIIAIALIPKGYEKPIKNYLNGMEKCNGKTYVSAFPQYKADNWMDSYNCDTEDELYEEYAENLKDMMDFYEEEYGENIKFSYKIKDATKLSDKKLGDLQDSLESWYDVDPDDVKAAYSLRVSVTIEGKDDEETDTSKYTVAKIDGKWGIVDGDIL